MVSINGKTRLLGVLGWPVSHSLSPVLHNAAATHHQLPYVYVPLPVHPDHLAVAVRGLPVLGFHGVNVTIPHKQRVIAYLDGVDAAATAIGAVNTILIQLPSVAAPTPALQGTNTDWSGFLADLEGYGFDPAGQDCLVLGAGGSARAIVYALAQRRGRVHLYARRIEQVEQVIEALSPYLPGAWLNPVSSEQLAHYLAQYPPTLIVNTTPLGMTPHRDTSPWPEDVPFPPGAMVYDLVYNPATTKLMRDAAAQGCRALNGLGMLIHQGVQALQLWTGVKIDVGVVAAAVNSHTIDN